MNPEKTVKIAVIGCGARAHVVVNHLLREGNGRIKVASLYDPDREMMAEKARLWDAAGALQCGSHQEAIAAPGIEWVMVCSPNCAHKEHILAAFAAGKHVFAEKPLATAMEECRTIHAAHQQSGRLFATGFVLRYAPLYLKVRELLNSGRFGYIVAIDASESIRPEHGGLIMAGWRRHRSVSGPHLLEKCCHDLDLLNWFAGALPVRAAAFGGRNFFIPANAKISRKYGDLTFQKWSRFDPHTIGSPFTDDTDLMDNTVFLLQRRYSESGFVHRGNSVQDAWRRRPYHPQYSRRRARRRRCGDRSRSGGIHVEPYRSAVRRRRRAPQHGRRAGAGRGGTVRRHLRSEAGLEIAECRPDEKLTDGSAFNRPAEISSQP